MGKKTMRLYTKVFITTFLSSFLLLAIMSLFGFRKQSAAIQKTIDDRLYSIAILSKELLPSHYYERIIDKDSISDKEYEKIVDRFDRICEELNLKYIWCLMEFNKELVFIGSTSPDHNVKTKSYAKFYDVHANPEIYEQVLLTNTVQYQTNKSPKWGPIRAVLIPFTDSFGRRFIWGTSVELSFFGDLIKQAQVQLLIFSIVMICFALVFSYFLSGFLTKPLNRLVKRTSEIAGRELNQQIPEIKEMGSYEEKRLINSFNLMNHAISSHIKELVESQENLKITLESIGDGVIVVDTDGCITSINTVAANLIEWSKDEAKGKSISFLFNIHNSQTNQIIKNPVHIALETKEIVSLERNTILTSRSGKVIHIIDSAAPILVNNGDIIGVILVFKDVTEEHFLQDQLRQSQKMDAIGQLAGGIAHDFNNMVGGIYGATDLLRLRLEDDKKSLKYLDIILRSMDSAKELTKKLLSFSRKQSIPSTAIDIHDLLNSINGIFKSTLDKRINLLLTTDAKHFLVAGDSSQLQSIFLNLGINASHAMAHGGNLHYRTSNINLDQEFCNSVTFPLSPGEYISIEVIDDGEGMDPEIQAKIFEPFFTTKEQGKGTGLGLSMAYGTIRQHDGMITVKSQKDVGSVFQIFLPTTKSEKGKSEPVHLIRGSGNILLVDDEYVMRETGEALLEDLGYTVTTAENGRQAIDIIKTGDKFDLVISDMNMPVLDGYDCFYKIREIREDLPVLISSGFPQKDKIEEMKRDGLNGYIQKPFGIVTLSVVISDILKKQ